MVVTVAFLDVADAGLKVIVLADVEAGFDTILASMTEPTLSLLLSSFTNSLLEMKPDILVLPVFKIIP